MKVVRREVMVDYTSEKEFLTDMEARHKQGWLVIRRYANDMGKYQYTAIFELDTMSASRGGRK